MKVLSDKWTAVTKDGSSSAHFEHWWRSRPMVLGSDAAVSRDGVHGSGVSSGQPKASWWSCCRARWFG